MVHAYERNTQKAPGGSRGQSRRQFRYSPSALSLFRLRLTPGIRVVPEEEKSYDVEHEAHRRRRPIKLLA